MDIPRIGEAKRRRKRRAILAVVGLLALAGITMGLMRLPQAAPSVPRATLYFGIVKKGEMLRQVRGNGTLLPEEIRWVPAVNPGRDFQRIFELRAAPTNPTEYCRADSPSFFEGRSPAAFRHVVS